MAKQAIDAHRKTIFMMDASDPRLVIIGRDTADGPNHPHYDRRCKKPFDEDIVTGMMNIGVKEAIEVVKSASAITLRDGRIIEDALVIINGRQRTINAREADRRLAEQGMVGCCKIPVSPPEKGSDAKLKELTVMLNEHRQDDSPLGRAEKAQWFVDQGHSIEDIAPKFRCSPATIANYLSLLDLRPEIQAEIESGAMPATMGYALARQGTRAQEKAVKKIKTGGKVRQPAPKAPSKDMLRRIVKHHELPDDFLRGLYFALGLLQDVSKVPGLPAILEALSKDKTVEQAGEEDAA